MIQLSDALPCGRQKRRTLASEQEDVDWFDFWLNGHEDPDLAKAEQYTRWRKLREMQKATEIARGRVQ